MSCIDGCNPLVERATVPCVVVNSSMHRYELRETGYVGWRSSVGSAGGDKLLNCLQDNSVAGAHLRIILICKMSNLGLLLALVVLEPLNFCAEVP